MRYAADLHLHSRHSRAVSKHMTVETIGWQARRKGIDVIATGDCLQPEWRRSLAAHLAEAEPGWFALRPEVEDRITRRLSPNLRRPLRFVLSTEVSCTRPNPGRLRGLHHLLYFPSLASAEAFAAKAARFGDLAEGRPELALTSRELLEMAMAHDARTHLAPAHVMNPYFSCYGVMQGHARLEEVFGDQIAALTAVETGLTSTPEMCRRLSNLDGLALFSNSDAHSPENIGRECTLLETAPGYDAMFAALRAGQRGGVVGTLKFPLVRTRYYRNRCAACARSFPDRRCPRCGATLVMGSHDRLALVADRAESVPSPLDPPFRELLPLKPLLGELLGVQPTSRAVVDLYEGMLRELGNEREILTHRKAAELARWAPPPVVRQIVAQRSAGHDFMPPAAREPGPVAEQPTLL